MDNQPKARDFVGLTDTGVVRSVNQDYFHVDEVTQQFFVVADGMGGHAGGQEASRIATETIRHYLQTHWNDSVPAKNLLREALKAANQAILDDQDAHPERGDMGTTAVILIYRQEEWWCAHVGDSRLYRLRDRQLEQITADHTWVGRAMRSGDITPEQAKTHPWRHVLSQCLGRRELYEMDIQPLEVVAGDRVLICSDGLTEEVSDEEITAILGQEGPCEILAQTLINAAKKNGGSDNITVVVLEET